MSDLRDIEEQLREQAMRRSGGPTMEAGHTKMLEWMAADEIASLRAQLPEGMEDCTIQFVACELGHGRLTAKNWVDTGCHWCRIAELQDQLASARKALEEIADHPESKGPTPSDQSSYAVGWAFWNVKRIAKAALTDELRGE